MECCANQGEQNQGLCVASFRFLALHAQKRCREMTEMSRVGHAFAVGALCPVHTPRSGLGGQNRRDVEARRPGQRISTRAARPTIGGDGFGLDLHPPRNHLKTLPDQEPSPFSPSRFRSPHLTSPSVQVWNTEKGSSPSRPTDDP